MAATDLYELLEGCHGTLVRLFLDHITLDAPETIAPLSDFCTVSAIALTELGLEHLYQAGQARRIAFIQKKDSSFAGAGGGIDANVLGLLLAHSHHAGPRLQRCGSQVYEPIEFVWRDTGQLIVALGRLYRTI